MADNNHMLLGANLKQLKLPAMGAEFVKLAREAADANEDYEQYLLRLSELEVAARASNAVQARTRAAGFPVAKDFDTFDFSAVPSLSKPKVLELARGEWIEQRTNTCFIGSPKPVTYCTTFPNALFIGQFLLAGCATRNTLAFPSRLDRSFDGRQLQN